MAPAASAIRETGSHPSGGCGARVEHIPPAENRCPRSLTLSRARSDRALAGAGRKDAAAALAEERRKSGVWASRDWGCSGDPGRAGGAPGTGRGSDLQPPAPRPCPARPEPLQRSPGAAARRWHGGGRGCSLGIPEARCGPVRPHGAQVTGQRGCQEPPAGPQLQAAPRGVRSASPRAATPITGPGASEHLHAGSRLSGTAMWPPSRRQLCFGFWLVCGLSALCFLLQLHQDLLRKGLDLSLLCPSSHLLSAPVAMVCLTCAPSPSSAASSNASSSYAPQPESLSGTWTIYPDGRLGNQMGQYATLLALAQLNGRQAFIQPSMHATLAPVFRITLPVLAPEVDSRTPWKPLLLHDWMSEEYSQLREPYLKLSGFPCSWTFFHHLRERIRSEFMLQEHLRAEAQRQLSRLQLGRSGARPSTFVGVHVRRGDYVHVMPNRWKGVVGDRAYLQQAMDWFRARYEAPVFVITSNGMKWCRENIDASRGDVIFAGDGLEAAPAKDFALLTQCNHTIMTVGTFGFWAAYLAGGDTVYLANFTLPDSEFLKIFKPQAAFLPEWVGIDADLSPLRKSKSWRFGRWLG